MKFLSKLSQILQAGLFLFTGFKPLLDQVAPGSSGITQIVSKDLTEIANQVVNAEQIGAALKLSGDQKLQAAAGPVAQILLASATFAGHPIANPDLFNQGAAKIAAGMADCQNALHEDVVKAMTSKVS